ncbi:MAG TPA: peptidylprolyl isomerase [Actinobacteria bacterium]|nr:peptidylprolyl isomerase [Actinomycetota bacterium]
MGCVMLLAGCKVKTESASKAKAKKKSSTEAKEKLPTKEETTNTPTAQEQKVLIETEKGQMTIVLYPDVAPKTVESFITLIQKGFYNDLTFHRVEPGFVVQGGDPQGNGSGGPGYTIKAEFNSKKHIRGTVAMARSADPDSAGSQFYICLAPQPSLDGKYTVFGQVVEGMDVVDKIAVGDVMKRVYLEPAQPE